MKIKKKSAFIYLKPTSNSVSDFLKVFENKYPKLEANHIIIDFSEFVNIKTEDLLLFLHLSSFHKLKKFSFIIISPTAEIDELPYELSVVPTLLEAEDLIEMDNIERELGF